MTDLQQLENEMQRLERELIPVLKSFLRTASTRIGARAAGTYMREGRGESGPNRTSILRIRSGRLVKSLTSSRSPDSIERIEVKRNLVRLIKGTSVEYAAAHEYGYSGQVRIVAHTRRTRGRDVSVRAHTRSMTLARRAYLLPAMQQELPVLETMLEKDLGQLLGRVFA